MALPADSHVHSEWSWDAVSRGASMEKTCARAVEIGLPALAFTEHMDLTSWGEFTPPAFDAEGYLSSIERCRDMFPDLRILTGVELGEPHWFPEQVAALLAGGRFERVLGSMHTLAVGDHLAEANMAYADLDAAGLMRSYLAEIPALVAGCDAFQSLTHIDYAVRSWPELAGPFDPWAFEEEFRTALRSLAASDRALEINTRLPLDPVIVGWWREEGGKAVTFGSDAHHPDALANGFAAAAALAEANGFKPGRRPYDWWSRT